MLILFWVVVVLTAIISVENARYALRQYFADRNRAVLTTYFGVLFLFVYLVIHVTTRCLGFVQTVQDLNQIDSNVVVAAHRQPATAQAKPDSALPE